MHAVVEKTERRFATVEKRRISREQRGTTRPPLWWTVMGFT